MIPLKNPIGTRKSSVSSSRRPLSPARDYEISQNYFINQININNISERLRQKTGDSRLGSKRLALGTPRRSQSKQCGKGGGVPFSKNQTGKEKHSRQGSRKLEPPIGGWFGDTALGNSLVDSKSLKMRINLREKPSTKKIDLKKMCEFAARLGTSSSKVLETKPKTSQAPSSRYTLLKKVSPSKISKMLLGFKDSFKYKDQIAICPKKAHKRHSSFDTEIIQNKIFKEKKQKIRKSIRTKSMESLHKEDPKEAKESKSNDTFTPKITVSVRTRKGKSSSDSKKVNQDSFVIQPNFMGQETHLFGVYDGHGTCGHLVSSFIAANLPIILKEILSSAEPTENNLAQALHSTYQKIFELLLTGTIDVAFSGSTAVSCLVRRDRMWTSNSGDSRAVVAYLDDKLNLKCQSLSNDHKPDIEAEAQRIFSSGGRIEPFRQNNGKFYGPSRVWLPNEDVPGLAMSRAMGDMVACSVGVTWRPEISEYALSPADKYILIASDGLWEHLSNRILTEIVWPFYRKGDIEGACDELMKICLKVWKRGNNTDVDDITFILIFLE